MPGGGFDHTLQYKGILFRAPTGGPTPRDSLNAPSVCYVNNPLYYGGNLLAGACLRHLVTFFHNVFRLSDCPNTLTVGFPTNCRNVMLSTMYLVGCFLFNEVLHIVHAYTQFCVVMIC